MRAAFAFGTIVSVLGEKDEAQKNFLGSVVPAVPQGDGEMGYCFSIGLGNMMKPCCLTMEEMPKSQCFGEENGEAKSLHGGLKGWSTKKPVSPEEAQAMIMQEQLAKAAGMMKAQMKSAVKAGQQTLAELADSPQVKDVIQKIKEGLGEIKPVQTSQVKEALKPVVEDDVDAEEDEQEVNAFVDTLDENQDGEISVDEAAKTLEGKFRDGLKTVQEFLADAAESMDDASESDDE